MQHRIVLIMPALDEELALPLVLAELESFRAHRDPRGEVLPPRARGGASEVPHGATAFCLDDIVVVDNGSQDRTAEIARAAGATVLSETRRGYGAACLRALHHVRGNPPDIVVFMDADRSDDARDLPLLLQPIVERGYDLVIGSRTLGASERGALWPQARFGNWLATGLIRLRFGFHYTDLGPFRAVRFAALERLGLADRDFGWTLEMQVRALQVGLRVTEVPVRYRRRVGRSKISGTVRGSVRAGAKILATLWRLRQPGAAHAVRS